VTAGTGFFYAISARSPDAARYARKRDALATPLAGGHHVGLGGFAAGFHAAAKPARRCQRGRRGLVRPGAPDGAGLGRRGRG
jgi:hypothetical protein